MQWRSQEFTSGWARDYFSTFGWAQTQKFEDLPINLHLCKRFSKFLGGPVPTRPLFWLRYCLDGTELQLGLCYTIKKVCYLTRKLANVK